MEIAPVINNALQNPMGCLHIFTKLVLWCITKVWSMSNEWFGFFFVVGLVVFFFCRWYYFYLYHSRNQTKLKIFQEFMIRYHQAAHTCFWVQGCGRKGGVVSLPVIHSFLALSWRWLLALPVSLGFWCPNACSCLATAHLSLDRELD